MIALRQIRSSIVIARPLNSLIAAASVGVGAFLAGADPARNWAAAATMTFLVCSGAYAINDCCDTASDKVVKPWRPLVRGQLAPGAAWGLAVGLWAAAAVAASLAGRLALGFCGGWIGLLFLYSWKLKRLGIYGHLLVSLVASSGFVLGAGVAGNITAGLAPAGIAFGFHLAREIAKGVADVAGDTAAGVRTLAVRTGPRAALTISLWCTLAAALLAPVPFVFKMYGRLYLLAVVGIVYPLVGFCLVRALRARDRESAWEAAGRSVARALKYVMVAGLAAFVLARL